jgi:hypothetical protein
MSMHLYYSLGYSKSLVLVFKSRKTFPVTFDLYILQPRLLFFKIVTCLFR